MKVVILAGGFGTRLSEYTNEIPKPMVPIGKKPMIEHIMNLYAFYGHKDFYLALGYKSQVIKSYFKNIKKDWKINLIDTGINTFTGGRVKRLEKFLNKETFLLTYGDGISNININNLINFHKRHKKLVSVTAVQPPARFGALTIKGSKVLQFQEKIKNSNSWINGGFFVINPNFFNYLKDDKTILEKDPLEKVVKKGQMRAFKHYGFWQCMDHKSDRDKLEKIFKKNKTPWKK